MKTKNIIFLFLAIAVQVIFLAYLTCYSVLIKNSALKNGTIVSLSCTAYDPYDPFKGRYVRVTVTEENPYIKTADYYLQENLADKVDSISNKDFDELKPELELYVNEKGKFVQKGMTVLASGKGSSRIPIEEYLKNL